MKKILCMLMVLLILTGCTKSPKSVVEARLKELSSSPQELIDSDQENVSEMQKKTMEQFGKMLKKQTCTVDNEQIEGEKASVEVHMKTFAFGEGMVEVMKKYITEALGMAFGGATEEMLQDKFFEIWYDELKELEKKGTTKSSSATVTLHKEENEWVIDDLSEAFLDAFTGQLYSVFNNLGSIGN